MIRTPSLRGRMMLVLISALALVTILVDTIVYVSLRERLERSLTETLDNRAHIARQMDGGLGGPELAIRLADAGVPAIIRVPSGATHVSEPPGLAVVVEPPDDAADDPVVERRQVELGDGTVIEVQVARNQADFTLGRLLVFETAGSIVVLLLALLVLRRVLALVTRPVDDLVKIADAIASGQTDVRMEPSDPSTELGRMAIAFDRTVGAMQEALAEARSTQESSRRFLSDAAHQLRTPLAGLRASAESLLRNPESEGHDRLLANIARESVRAGRLVDSLLRMASMDAGAPLTVKSVDVHELLLVERDRALTLAPHLVVDLQVHGEDFVVDADAHVLKEALANLLDNARQHANERVDVRLQEGVGELEVVVEDDGPGVPEGEEERIFERFVSMGGSGSGLGLAIARGAARAHGGELTARGSAFELRLPRTTI